jgi:hypothetical protein
MEEKKDKVNKFAACSRCANNGCKFCPRCDGYSYWKLLIDEPVVLNDKARKNREYQRNYFQQHKKELTESRRAYFRNYYHNVIKKSKDAKERRRARSLKYYYDHHDEIRAKRNAKKKADLQDPVKGEKMRSEHTEYMRGYRKKKNESSTINNKEVIMK